MARLTLGDRRILLLGVLYAAVVVPIGIRKGTDLEAHLAEDVADRARAAVEVEAGVRQRHKAAVDRCGAVLAGISIAIIGSLIAGIPSPLDPMRLFRLTVVIVVTAFALISLMFLIMVRVTDPLLPRAIFGVLNTLLYFPSGAVYPPQGFPGWMQVIAAVDPFTYAVHAFKSLLLKNTGFAAITYDLGFLLVFSVVAMSAATMLFKRTL